MRSYCYSHFVNDKTQFQRVYIRNFPSTQKHYLFIFYLISEKELGDPDLCKNSQD